VNPLFIGAVIYIVAVTLASMAGMSFVNGGVNATIALTTSLACALIFVAGVSLLAKRMKLRLWLRASAVTVAAILSIPLAAIVGLVLAWSALDTPDYQEEINGLICRGFTIGNATVSLADERTELAVFRPITAIFERKLGTRSWQGRSGTPFTGFQNECAILHAEHVG
jgi:hypothetical protein